MKHLSHILLIPIIILMLWTSAVSNATDSNAHGCHKIDNNAIKTVIDAGLTAQLLDNIDDDTRTKIQLAALVSSGPEIGISLIEAVSATRLLRTRHATKPHAIRSADEVRLALVKKDLKDFAEAWEFVRTHPRGADAWEELIDFEYIRRNKGALEALTQHRVGSIVNLPETYLDVTYISNQLSKFENGGSYIVPTEILNDFGRNLIGRPDGQFITTSNELDQIIANANGNISLIEDALGIPSGSWQGKQLSRINVPNPSQHNIRIPSGNETAANEKWIPGGVTSGGRNEAVTDQIPIGSYEEILIN